MTTCQDFSKVVLRFGYTIIAAPRFWLGSTAAKSKAVIAIYRFPWGPVAKYTYEIYDLHGQLRCINLQKNHPSSGAVVYYNATTVWNFAFCW